MSEHGERLQREEASEPEAVEDLEPPDATKDEVTGGAGPTVSDISITKTSDEPSQKL